MANITLTPENNEYIAIIYSNKCSVPEGGGTHPYMSAFGRGLLGGGSLHGDRSKSRVTFAKFPVFADENAIFGDLSLR